MSRWWLHWNRQSGMAPATDRRRLSDVARHVIVPAGIVASEWPAVRETCRRLGWRFDGWQDGAAMLALGLRDDDEYAADTTVFSIPRQVGKTYLIGCIIFALCLMKPGLKVIWTAQVKDTALETFGKFLELIESSPRLKRHIRATPRGKGDEAILFNNGSSIEFGARESGFGRGRTDVDVIVFDEGQHLSNNALENLGASQNVAANPLCFVIGTPPRPQDKGEWFTLLRQEALDGDSEGTLYIEFSADRGADPMDRDQWRKANPSFPARTSERAMLRLRKKLKNPDSWRREALGVWDEITKQFSPINGPLWREAVDVGPPDIAKPAALAVDMSHSREISVGACWLEDTSAHVEEVWAGVDEPAAVEWVADAWKRAGRRLAVIIDAKSPASSMIPALKARRVKVLTGNENDMARGCGLVKSDLEAGRLTHADQDALNQARDGARKRAIGTAGGWGYDRKDPSVNIAPLVAVTLARVAATISEKPKTTPRKVVVRT